MNEGGTQTPAPEDKAKEKKVEQLGELERAAAVTSDPQKIQAEAAMPRWEKLLSQTDLGWFLALALGLGLLFILQWLTRWCGQEWFSEPVAERIANYLHGAVLILLILVGARAVEVFGIGRIANPISSFVGWIYILARAPYRVGDRIKMGDLRGDVIDVGYLDTTLWEFGGEYLSTDHPSGRVIKFPNSTVFSTAVINYSWPLFPYIWNEIKLNVAYESDLEFVGQTMQRITTQELGEQMMETVKTYRNILAQTPVDDLEVRERPVVVFRVSENTWVEAIVRYVVSPKEAGRVKTRLIPRLLSELNKSPDRVMFPKSNAR